MSLSSSSEPSTKEETLPGNSPVQNDDAPPPVVFRSELNSRTYVLNRPRQLNALNLPMLRLLKSSIEEWEKSPRCHIIIGTGNGTAFCAGGDVKGIVTDLIDGKPEGGIQFFKEEFELDHALALLKTPYVAILDGTTMGGGVGLSINAMFRVATEKTHFGMPETKIGYAPDVGASFFLPRMDGALGAYLGLTGESLYGREVFESGIGTHFVASHRLPALLDRLANLENPTPNAINAAIEEFHSERLPGDRPSTITGSRRRAIDQSFSRDSVEDIISALEQIRDDATHTESTWARDTLVALEMRSPTSLRIALEALKRGQALSLGQALTMELGIATAFCSGASPDFVTGVRTLLMDKSKERPSWSPNQLSEVLPSNIVSSFFDSHSPFLKKVPTTAFSESTEDTNPMRFSLLSEDEIGQLVRGEHPASSSTAFSLEELIEEVRGLSNGKLGVEEKVKEVVSRRCESVPKSGMQEAHLRWIH